MNTFTTIVLIIVAIFFALLMFSLTSNLWFFKKEEKIEGSKDLIISQLLQLAYKCYQQNSNVKGSVICNKMQIFSNEDILADEILSKLNTEKINKDHFFAEDLHANSKVIIRCENGNIFIEEERYESVSS